MNEQIPYPYQLIDVRLYEVIIERYRSASSKSREGSANFTINVRQDLMQVKNQVITIRLNLEIKGPSNEDPDFRMQLTLEGLFETDRVIDEIPQRFGMNLLNGHLYLCCGLMPAKLHRISFRVCGKIYQFCQR